MKKWKVLLISLLVAVMPTIVLARSVDYDVERVYIDAQVDMVGSLHIKEAIVIAGSLNGFERKLTYRDNSLPEWTAGSVNFGGSSFYNARGIALSKISAFKVNKDEMDWTLLSKDIELFKKVESAETGDESVFTEVKNENGTDVRIYAGSDSGYMVYYLDYFVDQAVVLHNDVAELFFGFWRLDADDVKEVNIQVRVANGQTSDVFRFWGRGGLDGTISPIEGTKNSKGETTYQGVLATLNNYRAGEDVTIRMTMDKRSFTSVEKMLNHSEQDALDGIIAYESKFAEEANRQKMIIKIKFYVFTILSIIYILGLIALWLYIYLKYDREYKVDFPHKYYREFIDDYNVEVVDYLMTKSITPNAMNASLMNLIYKGNVDFEETSDSLDVKDYKMSKKNTVLILKNRDGCNDTENKLLDMLFDDIGKDGRVTLNEIKKYSSKFETAEKFMKKYETWRLSATKDAMNQGFFEEHSSTRGLATLYVVLGGVLLSVMLILNYMGVVLFIYPPLMVIFLIYVWVFKKWSPKGREHYLKWKAFKSFLQDFGSFKNKEIPEIKLWDRYLVYATVFGIADQVEKAMKIQLTNMNLDNSVNIPCRSFTYGDFYVMNAISKSISTAHSKSQMTINEHNAKLSSSSGSGFGGGFSGGGFSGGGGGGGGGGF